MFCGIRGEAELFLGKLGAKAKYFYGAEDIIFKNWGDKCIIFRDQWSTDPPPPPPRRPQLYFSSCSHQNLFNFNSNAFTVFANITLSGSDFYISIVLNVNKYFLIFNLGLFCIV